MQQLHNDQQEYRAAEMVWVTPFPPPQSRLAMVALFLIFGLLFGCDTVENEQDFQNAVLSRSTFEGPVMDVFIDNGCTDSGCHLVGVGPGGRLRIDPNALPGSQEMENNFLSASSFANINDPPSSALLMEPTEQGLEHGGGDIFLLNDTTDPNSDYTVILNWISTPEQQTQ